MNESIYNVTSDGFKRMFKESLQVHPNTYDPTLDLRENPGDTPDKVRCYLPLEAKALRFFTFCEENGKQGKIYTSNYHMETFSTAEQGLLAFVTVNADVYIDDSLVGSAAAGQCCRIGDFSNPLDRIVQVASGLAKSRALSNAGFGVVDGTDVDSSALPASQNGAYNYAPATSVNPAGYMPSNQGYIPPNPAQNAPSSGTSTAASMPNHGYGQPVQSSAVPGAAQGQIDMFHQLGGQNDPLTQAKTMLYPLAGNYQGQTLGSLNTRTLEFLANKATNDPAVEAAVQAAKLILQDRNKANGKAK